MRSARTSTIAGGLAAVALAGCATTQQEATRVQLNSARLRAAQLAVRVTRADPDVVVGRPALIGSPADSAVVVTVGNRTDHPISDLPISVGVLGPRGRRVYLNSAAGLDYFQTHIPAIAGHGSLTWVFVVARPAADKHAFAVVGFPGSVGPVISAALPRLTISATASASARELALTIENRSAVPQYQLPVYAIARRGPRLVGAGEATVAHLGTHSSTQLQLALLGDPARGALTLEAPPTIFK